MSASSEWLPRVLGPCDPPCPERVWAAVHYEFGPAKSLGGWIFKEGPFRLMDDSVKWRARYFGQPDPEDHTGQPYIWVTCPWCGRDLRDPSGDTDEWIDGDADEQSDGC